MVHRVIIVDDADTLRRLLASALNADGRLEVVADAADGIEAIEAVKHHRPDVVLMDAVMPILDGYAATVALKRLFPDLPVLIFTGYADERVAAQAQQAGADVFLDKTTPTDQLADALVALAEQSKAGAADRAPVQSTSSG